MDDKSKDQGSEQIINKEGGSMDVDSEQTGKPPSKDQDNKQVAKEAKDEVHNENDGAADLIKMTIKPASSVKKHKLNPESLRTYLEYCLRFALAMNGNGFLKHLVVSKMFLGASQHYSIFCLGAKYGSDSVRMAFSSTSMFKTYNPDTGRLSNAPEVTYEKMHSVVSFLKPNHFFMRFPWQLNLNLPGEIVKKCVKNLNYTKGKVALMVDGKITAGFSDLMGHFANRRLEFLWARSELLKLSNSPLQLGYCSSSCAIGRFDVGSSVIAQFHDILRHNIEFLEVEIGESFGASVDEPTPPKRSKPNICDSLKKLTVDCDGKYGALMAILDDVKDRCPNLKMISVKIILSPINTFHYSSVSDADEIMENVLAAQEKIQAIVKNCRLFVSKLKIVSEVRLQYETYDDDEFYFDWIKRVTALELFEDSVDHEGNEEIDDSVCDFCQLDSEFNDDFLDLEHSTKVIRHNDELTRRMLDGY